MKRLRLPLGLVIIAAVLAACADKPLAPIEDRSRPGTSRVEQRYTVLRGDTLFSIAFRYGLDFRRLAAANAIAPPYTIFPGQTLRLAEATLVPAVSAAPNPAPSAGARPREESPAPKADTRPPATTSSKPPAKKPSSSSSSAAPAATKPVAKPATTTAVKTAANVTVSRWRWPISGKVTRRFDKNLHKGIDVSGKRGDAVLATAGGRVVYAGSGIAGYGLMLIVRHNDEYLSAYGHNDTLIVKEGEVVRGGQKIAERGSSGTDSVKLHFEIRRRGRPVDPLQLLPRR